MEIRYSSSTYKGYKSCEFKHYCKITKQPEDDDTDNSYGDSGNVVHHSLEYYYTNLKDLQFEHSTSELKPLFEEEWDEVQINNPKLDKDLYWLCVINGIKLDVSFTDLEYEFRIIEPGLNFIGYADVMDRENHIIGDWKTSTYKKSKVDEYRQQLKFYAWAYYKEFGVVPKAWVYFNKVNKKFDFTFTLEELKEVEKELRATIKEVEQKLVTLDFKREPSRTSCYFCKYKGVCATDLLRKSEAEKYEVTFHVKGNKVQIEASIPDEIQTELENMANFELKNAFFIKQAMAQRGVKYDAIKRLYRKKVFGGELALGYMNGAYNILKTYAHKKGMKIRLSIKDYRNQEVFNNNVSMPDKLNIPFEMFEFQKEAVDKLVANRWGIIEVGTGGGKTVIAAEAIRRISKKTLFVIDNKDLLLQTKKEYENMLGIECGVVGMGRREWNAPVVLCTIQTLAKYLKEFALELAQFPVVVYDETHIIASKSFEQLSKYLINTKYRFGFSATARRDDGNDKVIYGHTGEVVYRKPAKELIEDGVLVEPEAIFYKYGSELTVSDTWQNEYADGIVDNEHRNTVIKKIAEKYIKEGKQVMILTKMVRHGQWFNETIENSELIYGKTDDDLRVDILEDFKAKKFPCLVGNLKIFNKGLNIKSLDVIINASGNAGDVVTVQTIGRSLRKDEGKEKAYYIDFVDAGEYLKKHSVSRIESLKAEGYSVTIQTLAVESL